MEVAPAETVPDTETDALDGAVRHLIEAAGWSVRVEEPWVHAGPPASAFPDQGWKLHLSATEDSAPDVLAAVVPILLAEGTAFKYAAGRRILRALNTGRADRASAGKFLTVYPAGDDAARRIAAAAHAATAGLAGPVILSDRPYRPGSLVHYRYGGFRGRQAIDADGMVVHLIRTPEGELVPDERRPGSVAPPWAVDPFLPPAEPGVGAPGGAAKPPASRVLLNGRYAVTAALRHANKGGTYLATDQRTGDMVVIKEGRPHVAGTAGGGDARHAVHHEARMLELVGHLGRTPRLLDLFEQDGHAFLVEEHVEADSLRDLVDVAYEPPDDGISAATVRALARALAETVAAFHAAGLVLRDLTPNNVLVTDDGRLVLVDLELAHLASEAPTAPGGTPGYAAPEQLEDPDGAGHGFAADYWSLGATIAFLATGADPHFPAAVGQVWTDPTRLAAWLADEIADGHLDPEVAAVVTGAMTLDPGERLSPAGVTDVLTGRRSPAALPPRRREDATFDPSAVAAGVARWLSARLGTGSGGHLWPTGPTGLALDPVTVQSGASGVGLFLARAAAVMDDDPALRKTLLATAEWVTERVTAGTDRPPGLYFGLSGVVWFLTEAAAVLGRDDLLRRANELALALPVRTPNPDLSHGTAGVGLAQLHQYVRTGDDRFLARAILCAEQLVNTAQRVEAGPAPSGGLGARGVPDIIVWPVPASAPTRLAGTTSYGYAHGTAGIAAFLLAAGSITGESLFLTTGVEALDSLLSLTEDGPGGSAWWPAGPDDDALWPHWCNGSSGVGSALVRAYSVTGSRRYLDAATAAARSGVVERWRSSTVQCHGLAGDAELLLDLAAAAGDERYRAQARTAASSLWLRRRSDGASLTFPDDTGGAVSAAFGTGMAGVGSFFLRLATGGPRPLTLDEALPGTRR